jgi:hypothetical protein
VYQSKRESLGNDLSNWQWGEGDERLLPIYPEYKNRIIRWGKEEAEEAVVNKNKEDHGREFLY